MPHRKLKRLTRIGVEALGHSYQFIRQSAENRKQNRTDDRRDELFRQLIDKATRIEPAIIQPHLNPLAGRQVHLPSRTSGLFRLLKGVLVELAQREFDTVFLMSGWRRGGAERELRNIIEAMAEAQPDKPLLLLLTDPNVASETRWKDLPASLKIIEFSSVLASARLDDRAWLIAHLLLTIGARRSINCNSHAGWLTTARYGRRLSRKLDMEALLFCYDYDVYGRRAGYVPAFFRDSIPFLSAVYVDNHRFVEQLSADYGLTPTEQQRLKTLYHPYGATEGHRQLASAANRVSRPTGGVRGNKVLWASRPCKQKAVDLVLEIARLMPDIEFLAAGGSQRAFKLAAGAKKLPGNITFLGVYDSFLDLTVHGADAFLYTSKWDGLPNALIEAVQAGLPVIASNVGGISELITADSGWLIDEAERPAAYAAALREALTDRAEAQRRWLAASTLIKRRHSPAYFKQQLAVLGLVDAREEHHPA